MRLIYLFPIILCYTFLVLTACQTSKDSSSFAEALQWEQCFANGMVSAVYTAKEDQTLHGPAWIYDEFGGLSHTYQYQDGHRQGKALVYSPERKVIAQIHYKDSSLDGPAQYFYTDGCLRYDMQYVNGGLHGPYFEYYKTGPLRSLSYYEKGQKVGPEFIYDAQYQLSIYEYHYPESASHLYAYYDNDELTSFQGDVIGLLEIEKGNSWRDRNVYLIGDLALPPQTKTILNLSLLAPDGSLLSKQNHLIELNDEHRFRIPVPKKLVETVEIEIYIKHLHKDLYLSAKRQINIKPNGEVYYL